MTRSRRFVVALPDAFAACIYLWIWIAPPVAHPGVVGILVLALIIEFVAIQAGPFIGTVVYARELGLSPAQRRRTEIALGASYSAFAALAAASFDAWFPALLFIWLVGAKVVAAVLGRRRDAVGREREMTYWIVSAGVFFAAVFATLYVPLPPLGIAADGAVYGLRGQYEWANYPYKAIAAGFLYFAVLAVLRFLDLRAAADLSRSDPNAPA